MRKETIIKYEKEFLAWCKDESVLLGAPASMHDKTLIWREVRDFNDWKPLDTVYVLNDSYSDYRKALAEGKTVEFKHPQVGYKDWEIVTQEHIFQSVILGREYRIKPEESQFKVGDWLIEIHSNSYAKVLDVFTQEVRVKLYDCNSIITTENTDFKLWQPQPGEWCWFWNFTGVPILEQFSKYHDLDGHLGNYETLTTKLYYYCEPFIGQLPTILKE